MNERIEELLEQSSEVYDYWYNGDSQRLVDHKMFAELIVQECMSICEQQRLKILNNPNDPSWTEHLAECQTIMQQRFLRD